MKVLIVESEKKEEIKLTRLLKQADPEITIVNTLGDVAALPEWLRENPSPDLVLINYNKFHRLSVQFQQVHAKLVLRSRQYDLTYLAFRVPMLQGLQDISTLTDKSETGSLVQLGQRLSPTFGQYGIPQVFRSRFFVEQGQRCFSIPVEDIAYFFSNERLVMCHTYSKNKYVIQYRIEELEYMLDPTQFYRINRSHIISIRSIEQINPYFGGRYKLKLLPATAEDILVSRKRVADFKIWLGE